MDFLAFYLAAGIAVISTLKVIINTNPVHALLYLVISLIAVAMCFFALGAPLAGALEIIVYAGAIMVLFVFVVMLLNLGHDSKRQESIWLQPGMWLIPSILCSILLFELIYFIYAKDTVIHPIGQTIVNGKAVGISMFTSYIVLSELAALLLLSALVAAFHLGRGEANEI